LAIAAVVEAVGLSVRPILSLISVRNETEQKIGEAIHIAVLPAGRCREVTREKIIAIFITRKECDVVLIAPPQKFKTELEIMGALHPGEIVAEFPGEILLHAGMPELIRGAAQKVADVKHWNSAKAVFR